MNNNQVESEFRPMVKNSDERKSKLAGKYESDQEDDKKQRFGGADKDEQDRPDSRASVGSFSDLVLEEYEKMNIDPLLGAQISDRDKE